MTSNDDIKNRNNTITNNSLFSEININFNEQNYKQKRNTIEISKFNNYNFNFNKNISEINNNNSFYFENYECINKKNCFLDKIFFVDKSHNLITHPLYKDIDIFRKDPFNENLIIMNRDSDIESRENSIILDQKYLLKELDFAILSLQQKQCGLIS